jgi:aldose sugar dehydrogenase
MAFLPDGRMLVTQKGGTLVIVKADGSAVDATLSGVPAVNAGGQGGLLDVAVDPDFATDAWVYVTFSENGTGGQGTAVARGKLVGSALQKADGTAGMDVIYRQSPKVDSGLHFGSRLAFRSDKTLYVTLGDRGQDSPSTPTAEHAQNVAKTLGKVVRINRDGSIPTGNPASFGTGALQGLWSIGHRNPQGAAVKPGTDDLWLTEHGPRGGDELNRVISGKNYGWPMVSYGCDYNNPESVPSCRPGGTGGVHAPTYEEPKTYWIPTSTAPGGLMFYTGDKFPEWQGNVFTGGMAGTTLWRIVLNGDDFVSKEEVGIIKSLGKRVRNVEQGPDGWIYLLTDDGKVIRIDRTL